MASTSSLAPAQPLTGLFEWQVSADSGATWSSSISVNPGQPYRIRALASWTDGPNPSTGFAGCTFEQIDLIGADSSDVFGGASQLGAAATADFWLLQAVSGTPMPTLQEGTGASAGWRKLDKPDPSRRIDFGQLPKLGSSTIPNPDFSGANPIRVFELSALAGVPKTLRITAPWWMTGSPAQPQFRIYTGLTAPNRRPVEPAVQLDAVITIIPAPAAFAAIAILPLARIRRRGG
ncbi:MAG: hypothetical protein IT436_14540 [Phycisphaerales bacterium]|nr:hypothetical protein [Phycisphaerales bacterium]